MISGAYANTKILLRKMKFMGYPVECVETGGGSFESNWKITIFLSRLEPFKKLGIKEKISKMIFTVQPSNTSCIFVSVYPTIKFDAQRIIFEKRYKGVSNISFNDTELVQYSLTQQTKEIRMFNKVEPYLLSMLETMYKSYKEYIKWFNCDTIDKQYISYKEKQDKIISLKKNILQKEKEISELQQNISEINGLYNAKLKKERESFQRMKRALKDF
jgi:hypothetical protein